MSILDRDVRSLTNEDLSEVLRLSIHKYVVQMGEHETLTITKVLLPPGKHRTWMATRETRTTREVLCENGPGDHGKVWRPYISDALKSAAAFFTPKGALVTVLYMRSSEEGK